MAVLDRIKFDGAGDWLIYKCPSEQFRLGSQLIVNQSQEALFFKGGVALDLFGPGTHMLKTGNIPLLDNLVNLPFGGQTPFTAEVYFTNKTDGIHFKWGTKTPISVIDPQFDIMIEVRSFGSFGMKIEDSRAFITSLVGALNGNTVINHNIVKEHILSVINSRIKELIAKYITEKKVSIFNIAVHLSELSSICYEGMKELFETNGLKLTNFIVESVDTAKENTERLREALERRSELNVLGDHYYRQRSFDVLDNLAENEGAGGLASTGMGLGMGLGAGTVAGQAFGTVMNVQPTEMDPVAPITNLLMQQSTGLTCPSCQHVNDTNSKFCVNCGQGIQTTKKICYNCASQLNADAKFCNECGANQQSKVCKSCGKTNDITSKFCSDCGTGW